jgi:hypothetical protein
MRQQIWKILQLIMHSTTIVAIAPKHTIPRNDAWKLLDRSLVFLNPVAHQLLQQFMCFIRIIFAKNGLVNRNTTYKEHNPATYTESSNQVHINIK